MNTILDKKFYLNTDVVNIAKNLLGKKLCTMIDGKFTSGMIVETEAYNAPEDAASHAFNNRRTPRTEVMFAEGGVAYIYLIYGIYKLFNVISNEKEIPHAILIRAVEPLDGIDIMIERRGLSKLQNNLTNGPGLYTQALGIELAHTGIDLTQKQVIWIENYQTIADSEIIASPRVGLGKSVFEPFYSIPWRFRIKNNQWTSKAK